MPTYRERLQKKLEQEAGQYEEVYFKKASDILGPYPYPKMEEDYMKNHQIHSKEYCDHQIKIIDSVKFFCKETMKELDANIKNKVKGKIRCSQIDKKVHKYILWSLGLSAHRWYNGGVC